LPLTKPECNTVQELVHLVFLLCRDFTGLHSLVSGWLFPGCHQFDWSSTYHIWSGCRKSWSPEQTHCTFHSGMWPLWRFL